MLPHGPSWPNYEFFAAFGLGVVHGPGTVNPDRGTTRAPHSVPLGEDAFASANPRRYSDSVGVLRSRPHRGNGQWQRLLQSPVQDTSLDQVGKAPRNVNHKRRCVSASLRALVVLLAFARRRFCYGGLHQCVVTESLVRLLSNGLALALLLSLVASPAGAQGVGMGTLTGTVVDASTKAPVANVVVSASSPQLQGEQASVTDSTGTYRIPQLPPGTYVLRFEKDTYQPYSRGGIGLDADRTLRLNVDLLPETLVSPEITVVARTLPIDVGTTQSGLTVTSAFSQSVPVSPAAAYNGGTRSYQGLALAAPQVASDLFGISMAGASSPENLYLVDGLSFSDTGFGVNNRGGFSGAQGLSAGSDFSVEFVDQLNVITSGFMPEYGRTTGGVLSITTKSGGNEFHGSVFATWTPGFLAQTGRQVTNTNSVLASVSKLYNAGDVGCTLGGYILKDKLWFFVGFNPSQYKTELSRTVNVFTLDASGQPIPSGNGFELTPVPSATRNYYQTQTNYSYIGKLTYLINSNNRISLSIAGTPDSVTLPYSYANGDYSSSSFAGNDNTLDITLRLSSSFFEKRLLLDVTVGWHHQNNNVTAIDGTSFGQGGDAAVPLVVVLPTLNLNQFPEDPAISDPTLASICNGPNGAAACAVGGYGQGGTGSILRNVTEDRIQAKATVTYFLNALGHQTLKGGVDFEYISYENKFGYSGEASYLAFTGPTGPGVYLDYRSVGYLSAPDTPVFLPYQDQKPTAILPGAFVQDSWSIMDKVTLNIGVRVDSEYMYNDEGQLALALNNQWSPRLGFIWDPTYQGKSRIYASYAIYYEAVPLDLADRALIGGELITALHVNCLNPAATGQRCSNSLASLVGGGGGPNQYWSAIGADKELVDPNIRPQRNDEVSTGAEYEILPNARLGVNYTHRGLSRLIEDYSNNAAASYVLGNPGQGIASNFPQPARIYNGYTASLTKTLADHWQAQASYTYITLNGNVDGLFTPSQLDPNINAVYDLPQFLINSFGPLAADTQNRVKAYGSYQFLFGPNVGLTLGGAYNGYSGVAISALGGSLLYGGDVVYIIPRGSYGHLPWVHQFDLHATVDVGLGQDMRVQFGADCFNVLGSQQVTAVDESWVFPSSTPVKPIPNGMVADLQHIQSPNAPAGVYLPLSGPNSVLNLNFGHATAYQTPRNFRLLARLSF